MIQLAAFRTMYTVKHSAFEAFNDVCMCVISMHQQESIVPTVPQSVTDVCS